MPTGYTSKLYDGKPQTFAEFAMSCARAFGALVTMREASADAKIPDEFKPSDYHVKAINKARKELAEAEVMSDSKADALALREYQEAVESAKKAKAEQKALRDRYESMLNQAKTWTPPTSEHQELKKFMVEQLKGSIDFDCGFNPYPPTKKTADEYRKAVVERAKRDILYHAAENAKEIERAAERTRWVKQLRDSLKSKV